MCAWRKLHPEQKGGPPNGLAIHTPHLLSTQASLPPSVAVFGQSRRPWVDVVENSKTSNHESRRTMYWNMPRATKRLIAPPLCAAAVAFATGAQGYIGFGASYNYVLGNRPPTTEACTNSQTPALSSVTVIVSIIEDLVAVTPTDGFAFQLNANSLTAFNSGNAFQWQQYTVNFGQPDVQVDLVGGFNEWTAAVLACSDCNTCNCNPVGESFCGSNTVPLATLANAYTIPAGTNIEFELLIDDCNNDVVEGVAWAITGNSAKNMMFESYGATSGELSPIADLQLNIVGQSNNSDVTFSSGAGTITYYGETSWEPLSNGIPATCSNAAPFCSDNSLNCSTTGEESNTVYGWMPAGTAQTTNPFVQNFWIGPHTQLYSYNDAGTLRWQYLAASSNLPVGTGAQWSTYFTDVGYNLGSPPSVPSNTGIFTIGISTQEIHEWFDTNNSPSAVYTSGANAIAMAIQGKTYGDYNDTPYELTNDGTVWYNSSPQGPTGTWSTWSEFGGGAAVPGFSAGSTPGPSISILDSSDSPWVVNGDEGCGSDGNSHLYTWSSGEWAQQSECMYIFSEGDDCLFGVQYDSSYNSYLVTKPSSGGSWTTGARLHSDPRYVTSMAAIGSGSSLTLYYTDEYGDLDSWLGACSSTGGTITNFMQAGSAWNIRGVARDYWTQSVYFINETSTQNDIWMF
jgi:hypothetical protein